MHISAIILAAGRSSRFGSANKLLADAGGVPVISRVMSAVAGSPVNDVVLVLATDAARVASVLGPGRWRIVPNPQAQTGLASSIRAGVAALRPETLGALIVLGDMPLVTPDLISTLIARFGSEGGQKIVYPIAAGGQQGNPVLWPRSLFSELAGLSGDKGAKALLAQYHGMSAGVAVTGEAAFLDIDTVDDLKRLTKGG